MSQTTVKSEPVKRPTARKDMTKLQWTLKEMRKNYLGYVLLAPYYIIFLTFTVLPVIMSLVVSFTDFNMLQWPNFVFLDNYISLFLHDEIFLIALKNTLMFAVVVGPGGYFLSLFLAWFINELSPKTRAVVTLIFYAPSISGGVYTVWKTLFSSDSYGWMNAALIRMGIISSPIAWFENPSYIMPLCMIVALWMSLGLSFLSFIAGLQTVPKSLYEAAAVDGIRNRWQELWYITLPFMKPQLMFGAIMSITGSFGFGDTVSQLAGNPPVDYVGWTLTHHLGDYGSTRMEMGYASAIATVLFLIMMGANIVVQKLLAKVGQ